MNKKNIHFILIQIDEAHSINWPTGLKNTPLPQKNFEERLERANKFVIEDKVPFTVFVDKWENEFANKYKAWPDKYYCLDRDFKIIGKSQYGKSKDALINKDCCELIEELLI
jgi:hypothetical protein